ncbi:MAG: hypothetical protein AAGF11_30760 [Myxococcota bacterium]
MSAVPLRQRGPVRVLRALSVLVLGVVIIGLNIPRKHLGEELGHAVSFLAGRLRQVSFVQSWKMYAPNPQRAQVYMNLTAHYDDGSERALFETKQERYGWGTNYAWNKTREDIWRHYANFNPKRNNENRTWYLRGVCVREARTGPVPAKIVMHQVKRGFVSPAKVARGAPGLGKPRRGLVTVAYCRVKKVREMIEADKARRAG